jgi:hypothetical protein
MLIELLVLNIIRLRRLILASLMKNLKISCYIHDRLSQCQLLLGSAYIPYARRTSWLCMCYVCTKTRCKLIHICRLLLSLHRVGRLRLLQKVSFYVANSTVISSKTNSCNYRLYHLKIPARIVTSWKYHLIFYAYILCFTSTISALIVMLLYDHLFMSRLLKTTTSTTLPIAPMCKSTLFIHDTVDNIYDFITMTLKTSKVHMLVGIDWIHSNVI